MEWKEWERLNGKEGETTLLFVRVELIINLNVMFNTIHLVAQAFANKEQVWETSNGII